MRWGLLAVAASMPSWALATASCSSSDAAVEGPSDASTSADVTPRDASDAAPPVPPDADAGADADAVAPRPCPNEIAIGGDGGAPLSSFTREKTGTAASTTIAATGMVVNVNLASGATMTDYVTKSFPTSLTALHLEDEVWISAVDTYAELGCLVDLYPDLVSTVPRTSLFYSVETDASLRFGFDDVDSSGTVTPALAGSFGNAPLVATVMRLDLDTKTKAGSLTGHLVIEKPSSTPIDTVVDVPLRGPTVRVELSCGVYYAEAANDGASLSFTLGEVKGSICP
jgi:hypothetical protein